MREVDGVAASDEDARGRARLLPPALHPTPYTFYDFSRPTPCSSEDARGRARLLPPRQDLAHRLCRHLPLYQPQESLQLASCATT